MAACCEFPSLITTFFASFRTYHGKFRKFPHLLWFKNSFFDVFLYFSAFSDSLRDIWPLSHESINPDQYSNDTGHQNEASNIRALTCFLSLTISWSLSCLSFALFALHLTDEMLYNDIFAVIGDCNVLDFVDDYFKCNQFNERKGIDCSKNNSFPFVDNLENIYTT